MTTQNSNHQCVRRRTQISTRKEVVFFSKRNSSSKTLKQWGLRSLLSTINPTWTFISKGSLWAVGISFCILLIGLKKGRHFATIWETLIGIPGVISGIPQQWSVTDTLDLSQSIYHFFRWAIMTSICLISCWVSALWANSPWLFWFSHVQSHFLHGSNHAHFHQNSLQYSSMVCWKMFHLDRWFSLEKSSILDEGFVSASWVATSQASWALPNPKTEKLVRFQEKPGTVTSNLKQHPSNQKNTEKPHRSKAHFDDTLLAQHHDLLGQWSYNVWLKDSQCTYHICMYIYTQ